MSQSRPDDAPASPTAPGEPASQDPASNADELEAPLLPNDALAAEKLSMAPAGSNHGTAAPPGADGAGADRTGADGAGADGAGADGAGADRTGADDEAATL